ncbi:MAG: copper resistance protein CopC [Solirubrobacteraceae bacterium]
MRRALAVVLVLSAACAPSASAHAGLTNSDPPGGSALGATPTVINLTFSERPDAALSSIAVTGPGGQAESTTRPTLATGDPLTLSVPVRPLPKGVYTVRYRVDSAIDGHATTGSFSFGVQVAPPLVSAAPRTSANPVSSTLEVIARWVLLVGLVLLVGAATAALAGFGGADRGNLRLAGTAWLLSVVGLVLLVKAQQTNAGSSLNALLKSPVGHALIGRAIAIGAAGLALLVAWRAQARLGGRMRRAALTAAGAGAIAAIIVHVANGHAAASAWASLITVIAQSVHVTAAGIWIGGLAALVVGLRSVAPAQRPRAIKRFALAAAAGLVIVTVTGIIRAISELDHFDQLWSTGYGRGVLAKLALVAIIAAVALRTRRRTGDPDRAGDAGNATTLRSFTQLSGAELTLAAAAIAVAALLGTLAPPVASRAATLPGLSDSGSDVQGDVHVSLHAISDEPGPNRFTADVTNKRSGDPIRGAAVQLLFTPLDDPGVASSSLALTPSPDRSDYAGAGANLRFDGRWGVRVLVRRATGTVEVPLELDPIGPPLQVSVERIPGQPPKYTTLTGTGYVRISPNPERAGSSAIYVSCYTATFGGYAPLRSVVLTLAAKHRPIQQQPVRRVGVNSFVANVQLASGTNQIGVVAHTTYGARLRSVFKIHVPGG